jgi:betaine-aldehyde dehydrogenase
VLRYFELGCAETRDWHHRRVRVALAACFFVSPLIFDLSNDDMRFVCEEIFGPVMCVLPFDEEAEVVQRANDTEFGLSAGVFTADLTRAHRVIAQLQAGTCWINHYNMTRSNCRSGATSPGLGRENGRAAIEHYTQLKSVYVAMQDVQSPY